ncbi:MAG: DUF1949 domain-containing protein [Spirochaetes bacterium]|jgi:uncharacterized YigZ family protein|nr:DUF1949 domain-containing protein [Spirochaetota bacterium]
MAEHDGTLRVPTNRTEASLRIKNSRFIGVLLPVSSREGVDATLEELRSEHPGATHVVHAFSLGPPKSRLFGQSDDGEPKGTAGRPVLAVLDGRGVTNALLAVVRYFGGTKLGTGGLVRAYGQTAAAVLDEARLEELRRVCTATVSVDYTSYEAVREAAVNAGARVSGEYYGTSVTLCLTIPEAAQESILGAVRDASRGGAELEVSKGFWG